MAKAPTADASASAPAWDVTRDYDVTFSGLVDLGVMKLRPMHTYRIAGATLNTLPADKIASAVPCND